MSTNEPVLIVDSDPRHAARLDRILSMGGHTCIRAGTVADAIEAAAKVRFGAAVIDADSTESGGDSAARAVRSADPSIPVVIMTGDTAFDLHAGALHRGAVSILLKPFSEREALERVGHALTVYRARVSERIKADTTERRIARHAGLYTSTIDRMDRERRVGRELLATLSHELRTPLTPILAWADMLRDREDMPPAAREFSEVAGRRGRELLDVIDSLVLFIASTHNVQQNGAVACPVRQALEYAANLGVQAGLSPTVDVGAGAEYVLIDPVVLRGVLARLVSNAAKFGEPGGPLELAAGRQEQRVVIEVGNAGPAIAAEERGRVFEPFVQVDGKATREHGGLGLGLFIARAALRAAGGDLTLRDRRGGGVVVVANLAASSVPDGTESIP